MKRKIYSYILTFCVSVASLTGWADTTHVVQPGETIYRITHLYGITEQALRDANPRGIEGNIIRAGVTLVIPSPIDSVPVVKSSAAVAGTNQTEGEEKIVYWSPTGTQTAQSSLPTMNENKPMVETPVASSAAPVVAPSVEQAPTPAVTDNGNYASGVTLAIIMPFNLESASEKSDKLQMRSVEFYQGALLAVHEMRRQFEHVNILTYDLGTRPLSDILTDEALLHADVIVAPIEPADIRQVAHFGEAHGINVISPFAYCEDLNDKCTHLFQMNPSKTTLYQSWTSEVLFRFHDYEFVFVTDTMNVGKADPYVELLRSHAQQSGIKTHDLVFQSVASMLPMDEALGYDCRKALFIPTVPTFAALSRFLPALKNRLTLDLNPEMEEAQIEMAENEAAGSSASKLTAKARVIPDSIKNLPPRETAVLGLPEWQQWTGDLVADYYDLNVWMLSKFYADPFQPEVKQFYLDFHDWYARELMPIYPRYGLLGYDVAAFCLHMLHEYGPRFENHITASYDAPHKSGLQNAMHFERMGQGGYLNRGSYLVHFTPSVTIEKIEIK